MRCPKCSGAVRAIDTRRTEENEIYRKRKCVACRHVFYTLEFEVENNSAFQKEWSAMLKTEKRSWGKNHKKTYTLYLRENGEIVASGTAEECAKQMGITEMSFRTIVSRAIREITKKYEAETHDCNEEDWEEE